jgi:carbonic anhydrase
MPEEPRTYSYNLSLQIPHYKLLLNSRDALRSLIISQRLLGTREIALFHHTGCGMVTVKTPEVRKIVKELGNPGCEQVDNIDFLEFSNLETSVQEDVKWLKEHPLILPETIITGWVYEVETGAVRNFSRAKPHSPSNIMDYILDS